MSLYPKYKNWSKLKKFCVWFIVVAIISPLLLVLFTVKDMYIISVFKINVNPNTTFTVGKQEDIYFPALDSNTLSVYYDNEAKPVSWRLNKVEYLKINDCTLNEFKIDENHTISFQQQNGEDTLDFSFIKNLFANKDFQYISCRDYFYRKHFIDTFTQSLKSIIVRKKENNDSIFLILLDSVPVIVNNKNVYPTISGTFLENMPINKFTFFKTIRTQFYDTIQKNDYWLSLDSSFTARTTVKEKFTSWGASSL